MSLLFPTIRAKLPRIHAQQMRRRNSSDASPGKRPRLSRLPVPPLRDTLARYLKSLTPFLLEDAGGYNEEFKRQLNQRIVWAEKYERGLGQVWQQRLHELDKKSPHNWLDDNFWLKKVYLEWREPLVINSNWWLAFQNDRNVPHHILEGKVATSSVDFGVNPYQVKRAALLLQRMIEFRDNLATEELHPQTTRTGLWMHENTAKLYNVCRVPGVSCDSVTIPNPASSAHCKVHLMIRDWSYAVTVYGADNKMINLEDLEYQIHAAANDVHDRLRAGETAVPIGIMSAGERDTWARNREHLLSLAPSNIKTMHTIEAGIMTLCLDDYTYSMPPPPPSEPTSVSKRREMDAHLHNVRSGMNAHNRWFDKPLNLIVERNTRAGLMGEHSPCDALVPSIITEYALVEAIDAEEGVELRAPGEEELQNVPRLWERLDWVVDDKIREACVEAEGRAKAIIEDSDDSVLWFKLYGSEGIKKASLSPDAYIQVALQLAWYRTTGSLTATYETALTRMFKHGRTETIRSCTTDTHAFVRAMSDPSIPNATRYEFLQQAVKTHTGLTRDAATGRGIDRHLLGLRLVMQPGESSELLEDELFQRSQRWRLSTSGLSAGHMFRGTGFGASEHDGYGINYLAAPDMIKFGIESKHSCPTTSTTKYQQAIIQALADMYLLIKSPLHPETAPPELANNAQARL